MRSSPATNHSPRATHVRLGSGSEKSLVDCRQGRARAHRSERFNLEGHKAADQAPPPTDSCIARPHRPHPAYCVSGAHQSCGTSWCCPLLRCEGLLPGGEVWQREEDNSQGHSTAGTHSSDVAKLGGPTTAVHGSHKLGLLDPPVLVPSIQEGRTRRHIQVVGGLCPPGSTTAADRTSLDSTVLL